MLKSSLQLSCKKFGLIFLGLVFITSCGQDYNSNYNDVDLYGTGVDPASEFGQAYFVMRDRCFSCHGNLAQLKTSAEWVAANKVDAGDWDRSYIRNYLTNYGGSMPPNGDLSPDELTKLQTWVNNLSP